MPLSKKFWEDRADRLFNEWDAREDACDLSLAEFKKMQDKIEQACTISMMLNTMDAEVKIAHDGRII